MRPRVFPAEDVTHDHVLEPLQVASMRPRVFPAEDDGASAGKSAKPLGFNEAAGIPRGRPLGRRLIVNATQASMRPRVFPAEDVEVPVRTNVQSSASMRPRVFPAEDEEIEAILTRRVGCFNEAAGIPRGRPRTAGRSWMLDLRLQ